MATSRRITDSLEVVRVGFHNIQFGGKGDGYCYIHRSLECLASLTAEEFAELEELFSASN